MNAAAWETLLGIYRPVVYRMACGVGLQHADAEDLTQQVFVSIARAIDKYETGEDKPPFRAWLYRIARNQIINALSRCKPDRGAGSTSVRELLDNVPGRDDETTKELAKQSRIQTTRYAAEQIRGEFSDSTWQMFWRTVIEGESIAEVAKELSRSTGAVYMARYRVMQRLKLKVNEITDLWGDKP